jgi:hypothetical protein
MVVLSLYPVLSLTLEYIMISDASKKRIFDDFVVHHSIDCGDNSCRYATVKGGMRTNGGCRCSRNHGKDVEFYLRTQLHEAMRIIEELEAK